ALRLARLENRNLHAGFRQALGGPAAGRTRSHHYHVELIACRHGEFLSGYGLRTTGSGKAGSGLRMTVGMSTTGELRVEHIAVPAKLAGAFPGREVRAGDPLLHVGEVIADRRLAAGVAAAPAEYRGHAVARHSRRRRRRLLQQGILLGGS